MGGLYVFIIHLKEYYNYFVFSIIFLYFKLLIWLINFVRKIYLKVNKREHLAVYIHVFIVSLSVTSVVVSVVSFVSVSVTLHDSPCHYLLWFDLRLLFISVFILYLHAAGRKCLLILKYILSHWFDTPYLVFLWLE